MGFPLREYNLPDAVLARWDSKGGALVWVPAATSIVIGASNQPERDLFTDNVLADKIPVYKRPSGGETVLLSLKTIVVSISEQPVQLIGVKQQFVVYNDLIIAALHGIGVNNVEHRGISDLAINGRKILGSALYHSRDRVFFHAVINWNESADLIGKYIKHPVREPDYRQGRGHSEFVTSLIDEGHHLPMKSIVSAIEQKLGDKFSIIG